MSCLMVLAALMAAAGATPDGAASGASAYQREIEAWQKGRESRLRADGGWLTLAGLFWLRPGPNRFGADAGNEIVVPAHASPPVAGVFLLDGHRVDVVVAPGVGVTQAGKPVTRMTLRSDAGGGAPDVLTLGSLTLQVIDRQGRLGIRLKDAKSKARQHWKGLRYYPVNPRLRVVARFVAHPKPISINVPNVLGVAEPLPSPGYAQFQLDGKSYRLDPVLEAPGDAELFFIFRDQTAGKTTYGAGRFLYAAPSSDGTIVLDFNKAYSPPCAFTPYATCPLPPVQNRLPIAIEAGELFDGH